MLRQRNGLAHTAQGSRARWRADRKVIIYTMYKDGIIHDYII